MCEYSTLTVFFECIYRKQCCETNAVEVFSPGAWQRSEVGVARSIAGKGPDRMLESGSRSPGGGETAMT